MLVLKILQLFKILQAIRICKDIKTNQAQENLIYSVIRLLIINQSNPLMSNNNIQYSAKLTTDLGAVCNLSKLKRICSTTILAYLTATSQEMLKSNKFILKLIK